MSALLWLASSLLAPQVPPRPVVAPRDPSVEAREATTGATAAGTDVDDDVAVREGPAGLSPDTWERAREASDRALAWLAATQSPRGYWVADVGHKQEYDYLVLRDGAANDAAGEGHVGVAAICGLAFLAGGHLPDRGRYGAVVRRTLDYVLAQVSDSGMISDGGTRMYSHAFAMLFLAEVHGMDPGHPQLREALERAVHLVVDCQNQQGGWRYNAFTTEADMSVTVCQLQALRAARNIGIRVPLQTIDDAMAYVMRARTTAGPSRGLFYYKTAGVGAWRKNREYAINAAALTALLSAGVTDPSLHDPVLDFLDDEYEVLRRHFVSHYFFFYGNYYACQAFFQAGGPRYERFQARLVDDLLRTQRPDGSWLNDVGPGDAFATGMAAVLLQVPKQYLPIFQR
ncbi:MAG: terpene cyclase/mutase family protein [Planctomycetes bacterium]|nr:terpene cyclase/mutase family protein [Planctomycetota bacterium]